MKRAGKDEGAVTIARRKRRAVQRALPPGAKSPESGPFEPPKFANRSYDIRFHGAVADDSTDCGPAIAKAIALCAENGGGRVLIPEGRWLTGPIHLKSGVELHISADAVVRFRSDASAYLPAVFVRWNGMECFNYSPFIYANDCRNVGVTGRGTLLGQGAAWWEWRDREADALQELHQMCRTGVPVERRVFASEAMPMRPQMILFINCQDVLLEDFAIADGGPHWLTHVAYSSNVTIRGLRIDAPIGPNNDGIVIDSSRDVLIERCDLHTAEDCVSLKSGLNEDGWRVGRPTENVVVRHIRATHGHGGFSIGSDMSGDIRNVLVHDCQFTDTRVGIRMKAARGRGGIVENIRVRDIKLSIIREDAIQLTTEYPSFARADGRAPTFRDISITGLTCDGARCAGRLAGVHDAVLQRVSLENVTITADSGLHCESASHLRLENVRITRRTGPIVSLRDGQHVVIHGVHPGDSPSVFLDLRGRQTRDIRLRGDSSGPSRPAILLGIDVPHDALVHE